MSREPFTASHAKPVRRNPSNDVPNVVRQIVFHPDSWYDYLYWQTQDRRTLERINSLVRECQRTPFAGIGKPEPLKEKLSGCWSRRIDETNRLVYRVGKDQMEIVACRYRYDNL